MKKNRKKLQDYTKQELIDLVRNQSLEIQRIQKEYHRALRCVASYRNIIQTELRSSEFYWDRILDDMVDEMTEEPTPPDPKEPQMKSKKKGMEAYA